MTAAIERSRLFKQKTKVEEEKGIRLAPSAKDLKPWYTDEKLSNEDLPEDKRCMIDSMLEYTSLIDTQQDEGSLIQNYIGSPDIH